MLAHLVLDAGSCCALALGLSGWFSTAGAALSLVALALIVLLSGAGTEWLPLADLGGALRVLQEGRVPALPALPRIAAAVALAAGGLGLAALSLVRWRRER